MVERPERSRCWNRSLSRRRMVQSAAGGTAVFLAGCLGDDENPDDIVGNGNGNGDDGDVIDVELRDGDHHWMDDANLNTYAGDTAGGAVWRFFPGLADYSTEATFYVGPDEDEHVTYGEFRPGGAEEWHYEENEMYITLRDNWEWSSGDPVTADDLVTRLRLDGYYDAAIWDFTEQVYADDDRTAVLEFDQEYDPDLIEHTLFEPGMAVNTPVEVDGEETIFTETLEALEDAGSEEEEDELLLELAEFNWYPGDLALSGPYAVDRVQRDMLILERNEGFWDPINFAEFSTRTVGLGGAPGDMQAVVSNQTDLGPIVTPEQAEAMPPELHMAIKQGIFGVGFGFNYEEGGHYADRNFRRAIAYVLSKEHIQQGSNPLLYGIPEYPATNLITTEQAEDVLGDHLGDFERYDQDEERAAELMREAGFENDGGTWVDENGDPLEMNVSTAEWDGYPEIGQMVTSALQSFGIEVDLETLGSDAYANMVWGDQSHEAAFATWGGAHPYNAFQESFAEWSVWNTPAELEVPETIGDPDSPTETVNVRELTESIPELTGEELEETLVELSWAFNQNLPIIPLVSENMGVTYWTDEWEYPGRDDPIWGIERNHEKLTAYGLVRAKE